jgi:hypothetical protein
MKPSGFSIKPSDFLFHNFYTILHFDEFCRTRCFEFLNSVLTKNLEMDYSFFRLFISKFLNFWNFKFDRSVFKKLVKPILTSVFDFYEN